MISQKTTNHKRNDLNMIIPLNIKKENTYYKIFEDIKITINNLNSNIIPFIVTFIMIKSP